MLIIPLKNLPEKQRKRVVTVGNFDGVHLGHLAIFHRLQQLAKAQGQTSSIITFEPLTGEYFNKRARLGFLRDKYNYIKSRCLADELIVLRFGSTLESQSPLAFLEQLKVRLSASTLVVGEDWHFGKDRSGDVSLAKDYFVTEVVPSVKLNSKKVSSSIIRQFAQQKDLKKVETYLGHRLSYTARVVKGQQLGRKFGVPTANLGIYPDKFLALTGIYLAQVNFNNKFYPSVVSIGQNPTVTSTISHKVEAHLLGVNLNLYNQLITVELLEFLRPELKFPNLEKLFEQIHTDLKAAESYFSKQGML